MLWEDLFACVLENGRRRGSVEADGQRQSTAIQVTLWHSPGKWWSWWEWEKMPKINRRKKQKAMEKSRLTECDVTQPLDWKPEKTHVWGKRWTLFLNMMCPRNLCIIQWPCSTDSCHNGNNNYQEHSAFSHTSHYSTLYIYHIYELKTSQ